MPSAIATVSLSRAGPTSITGRANEAHGPCLWYPFFWEKGLNHWVKFREYRRRSRVKPGMRERLAVGTGVRCGPIPDNTPMFCRPHGANPNSTFYITGAHAPAYVLSPPRGYCQWLSLRTLFPHCGLDPQSAPSIITRIKSWVKSTEYRRRSRVGGQDEDNKPGMRTTSPGWG